MYGTGNKDILLWCYGKSQDTKTNDNEGDEEASAVTKQAKSPSAEEKELEEGIQSIHADEYDYGQYRLRARMIRNSQWKKFNNPPNVYTNDNWKCPM